MILLRCFFLFTGFVFSVMKLCDSGLASPLLLSAAQSSVSPPQSPPFQLQPVQLLSSAQSRPQCVYLLWPCSPTNVPSPFPVPSVPLPLSPYPPSSSSPSLHPSTFLCLSHQCFLPQSPLMFKDQMQQDVIMVLKFPSNSPVTHVAANTLPHLSIPAAVTVTCSRLFAVNRWHNTVGECVEEKVEV